MSLGKIKFQDGREVELVEVQADVIIIERAGKDGAVKQYRLKKDAELYEQVEEQVMALLKNKKKEPDVEPEDDDFEDEEVVEEKPAKKQKKTVVEPEPEDEEVEDKKPAKKAKKVLKETSDENDEILDTVEPEEVEDRKPAKKTKAEKTSKVSEKKEKKDKAEDLYDYDTEELDGYQKLTVAIEDCKNASEAAKYFFTAENQEEVEAIIFMLNADRVQTTTENCNLSVADIKKVADETKNRVKKTNYVELYNILTKLTDGDNSELIPEIVANTAVSEEKTIFIAFDKASTKRVFGFLEKNLKELASISESIANKLL